MMYNPCIASRKITLLPKWIFGSSFSSAAYSGPIVVSGVSGRFPSSANMDQFKSNLLEGRDMIKDQVRWSTEKIPTRVGFLDDIAGFDNKFFKIPPKLANSMHPAQRILMEVTFEAIFDSGINPQSLRGSSTGVYVAAMGSDYREMREDDDSIDAFGTLGVADFLLPNTISYHFGFHGPSLVISSGCSASLVALEAAVNGIRSGSCDSAIVAGASLYLNQKYFHLLRAANALSVDGKCMTFDAEANGYARSESVGAIYIQKVSDAKRSYVTLRSIKTNTDGYKDQGLTHPSGILQEKVMKASLQSAEIDPSTIKYIEAHGTGTPVGDPQEVSAIYGALCKDVERKEPLLIGSVKSNMGHAESAAGIAGIAKILIMSQTRIIPPNLHFKELNPEIAEYFDDSLQIVDTDQRFDGGFVGINSFGWGGTNAHAVFETNQKMPSSETCEIPLLYPISGQSRNHVEESLASVEENGHCSNFAALLHSAHETKIIGHNCRGYSILGSDAQVLHRSVHTSSSNEKRPVWIIFPGMGSQWSGMGEGVMKLESFSESIKRSAATLKNADMDLHKLLEMNNSQIFTDMRCSLVSIAAVQIALYDTFVSLGIEPAGLIGHSAGEAICAYADGCLSAEETLLVQEARGQAFSKTNTEPLAMASVGISWEEAAKMCPENVFRACKNGPRNISLSGSAMAIHQLVQKFNQQNIFAKVIDTCNTAPHSPFMKPIASYMLDLTRKVVPNKRQRSKKWISTSLPESQWKTDICQHVSPEYLVNNALSPVLFYDAIQKIPENAIVLELSPKGVFQGIFKECLPKSCTYIAPMHPKAADKLAFFLQSVGEIYNNGIDVKFKSLYPPPTFPVPAETPFLGSLVRWNHERSWKSLPSDHPSFGSRTRTIDLEDSRDQHLSGHKVQSEILYPCASSLVLLWQIYASSLGIDYKKLPVKLSDVQIHRQLSLREQHPSELTVSLLESSNQFEITEGKRCLITGKIEKLDEGHNGYVRRQRAEDSNSDLPVTHADIAKEMRLRGYNYDDNFCQILRLSVDGSKANIRWKGDWMKLIHGVLQCSNWQNFSRTAELPTRIHEISLNPGELDDHLIKTLSVTAEGFSNLPVTIHKRSGVVECPGITLKGLQTAPLPQMPTEVNGLNTSYFRPYFDSTVNFNMEQVISEYLDLIVDNVNSCKIKTLDLLGSDSGNSDTMQHKLRLAIQTSSQFEVKLDVCKESLRAEITDAVSRENHLVCIDDLANLPIALQHLQSGGFVLLQSACESIAHAKLEDAVVVSASQIKDAKIFLLRKRFSPIRSASLRLTCPDYRRAFPQGHGKNFHIPINDEDMSWVNALTAALEHVASSECDTDRIYLTAEGDACMGAPGVLEWVRGQNGADKVRVISHPERLLNFSNPSPPLRSILEADLISNIFSNGHNGWYRSTAIPDPRLGSDNTRAKCNLLSSDSSDTDTLRMAYHGLKLTSKGIHVSQSSTSRKFIISEFSGTDSSNKRVMGITSGPMIRSKNSFPRVNSNFRWQVPEDWTLEDAATVPLNYSLAYYALFMRGQLDSGSISQSVIIRPFGTTAGLAAIIAAVTRRYSTYVIVENSNERKHILDVFPMVGQENVGMVDDFPFLEDILTNRAHHGFDLVLSCANLGQEYLLNFLKPGGKSVILDTVDTVSSKRQITQTDPSAAQHYIIRPADLLTLSENDTRAIWNHVQDGISQRSILPLPRLTHPSHNNINDPIVSSKNDTHFKNYLAKVSSDSLATSDTQPKSSFSPVRANLLFDSSKVYIVLGAFDSIGLELSNWLVLQDVRHLMIPLPVGTRSGYQRQCLNNWRDLGVKAETPAVDLDDFSSLDKLFQGISESNEILVGGIFNLLGFKDESRGRDRELPNWKLSELLDKSVRKHIPNLDCFVIMEHAPLNSGSSDEAAKQSISWSRIHHICEQRIFDGHHGLALQFPSAENASLPETSWSSWLKILDAALHQPYASIKPIKQETTQGNVGAKEDSSLEVRVGEMLGIPDVSYVGDSVRLSEVGMDSLFAMELRKMLDTEFQLNLSMSEIRSLTIGDLRAKFHRSDAQIAV